MAKDRRYTRVKHLIAGGHINTFQEIFSDIPKSIVARDLGINNIRFTKLISRVDRFVIKDLFRIAELIEIDEAVILKLLLQQYQIEKENKMKK
jgi:hypothetical protein